MILQRPSRDLDRAENRAEHDGGRALDVIIECQESLAVTIQNGSGMRRREVFPMQKRVRQLLLDRAKALVNEIKIRVTRDPLVTPTEILRIREPLLIICPHVQDNGQRAIRANSANQRIQR